MKEEAGQDHIRHFRSVRPGAGALHGPGPGDQEYGHTGADATPTGQSKESLFPVLVSVQDSDP